jgi:hypothetical protein
LKNRGDLIEIHPDETTIPLIQTQLARILMSKRFKSTHRLSRFLGFAVSEALQGRHERLKEYVIGVEVFERPETFDPRVDSIVRVEAGRLRAKMLMYYRTEGLEDEIFIQFNRGTYVPRFFRRLSASVSGHRPLPGVARVLMVGDDPGCASLVRTLEATNAYQIALINEADTTEDRIRAHEPDVVILAGENGVAIEERCQRLMIPVVRIRRHEITAHSRGGETTGYLVRPFSGSEPSSVIEMAIEERLPLIPRAMRDAFATEA